jgi:hypothetical protein
LSYSGLRSGSDFFFPMAQNPSTHLQLLKTVALYEDTGNPLAKRRIALRSSSSARAETKRLVDVAQSELYQLVPSLLDGSCASLFSPLLSRPLLTSHP